MQQRLARSQEYYFWLERRIQTNILEKLSELLRIGVCQLSLLFKMLDKGKL
jgi:hypothetical protein